MRVILSTVGTSMATTKQDLKPKFSQLNGKTPDDREDCKELYDELKGELLALADAESFDPVRYSAETHSLHRMNVTADDVLYFLVSDTLQGKLCGEVLVALSQKLWNARAEYFILEGMQVTDARRFQEIGVFSLVQKVKELIERHGRDKAAFFLNATGGFKATVPYMTLMGLIEGIPVTYIYENASTLIELPAVPVRFDREEMDQLYKLERIQLESGAPSLFERLKQGMSLDDFAELSGMTEEGAMNAFKDILVFSGGRVTMSALTRLIYERDYRPTSGKFRTTR